LDAATEEADDTENADEDENFVDPDAISDSDPYVSFLEEHADVDTEADAGTETAASASIVTAAAASGETFVDAPLSAVTSTHETIQQVAAAATADTLRHEHEHDTEHEAAHELESAQVEQEQHGLTGEQAADLGLESDTSDEMVVDAEGAGVWQDVQTDMAQEARGPSASGSSPAWNAVLKDAAVDAAAKLKAAKKKPSPLAAKEAPVQAKAKGVASLKLKQK